MALPPIGPVGSPSFSCASVTRSTSHSNPSKTYSFSQSSQSSMSDQQSKYKVLKPSAAAVAAERAVEQKTHAANQVGISGLKNGMDIVLDRLRHEFDHTDKGIGLINLSGSDASFATLEKLVQKYPGSAFEKSTTGKDIALVDFHYVWMNHCPHIDHWVAKSGIFRAIRNKEDLSKMQMSKEEFDKDTLGRIFNLFPVVPPVVDQRAYTIRLGIAKKEFRIDIQPIVGTESTIQRQIFLIKVGGFGSETEVLIRKDIFRNWETLTGKKVRKVKSRTKSQTPTLIRVIPKSHQSFPKIVISQTQAPSQQQRVHSLSQIRFVSNNAAAAVAAPAGPVNG